MSVNKLLSNPRVSVIIPAFNTGRYIARALQSALDQTERSIEIIVVDDCSTDNTLEIARSFLDERIKVLSTERNSGPSHARNLALQVASGEWLAILDSDDWYAPDRIAQLLEVAHAHAVDLIADDLHMIQEDAAHPWGTLFSQYGSLLMEARAINAIDFVESNLPGLRHLGLGTTKPLIRFSFLKQHGLKYNETLRCGEDFELYLMCLLHGACFRLIPEAHYFYRSRPDSIIAKDRLNNLDHLRRGSLALLQHKIVNDDTELVLSLSRRLTLIEQRLMYYRIVQPLKERSFSTAFLAMVKSPDFFSMVISSVPGMLRFRLHRRFRKIKNKFMAPVKNRAKTSGNKVNTSSAHTMRRKVPAILSGESAE